MRRLASVLAILGSLGLLAGCATSSPDGPAGSAGHRIVAVASINAWGSILSQLGGEHVSTTSIISNPDTDPHDYEPTPSDARLIAGAQIFLENGIGYDSWAAKAVRANPASGRQVLDVGALTGTPGDGNPHRWYSPSDVEKVSDAVTAALKLVDPRDADYFDSQRKIFDRTGLAEYHRLIAEIRSRYAGTPVGASESIFAPLSDALGLKLLTPATFLRATSEGADPSAADKATIDSQISGKKIKVYVFNRQNSTPDISAQVTAAQRAGIPITALTETLSPAGTSFQDWQVSQLQDLRAALAAATGR